MSACEADRQRWLFLMQYWLKKGSGELSVEEVRTVIEI
jgi:hypothetical protein